MADTTAVPAIISHHQAIAPWLLAAIALTAALAGTALYLWATRRRRRSRAASGQATATLIAPAAAGVACGLLAAMVVPTITGSPVTTRPDPVATARVVADDYLLGSHPASTFTALAADHPVTVRDGASSCQVNTADPDAGQRHTDITVTCDGQPQVPLSALHLRPTTRVYQSIS